MSIKAQCLPASLLTCTILLAEQTILWDNRLISPRRARRPGNECPARPLLCSERSWAYRSGAVDAIGAFSSPGLTRYTNIMLSDLQIKDWPHRLHANHSTFPDLSAAYAP